MMSLFDELDPLFHPRSVAVAGVSGKERDWGGGNMFVRALQHAAFPGPIYPINPKVDEFAGMKFFPSVRDVPGPVDYVISSVPSGGVLQLMDDCVAKGVRAVHFFTAGFRETGDVERVELERQVLAKARAGGVRIVGPNCMGLYVPAAGLSFGDDFPSREGPVGFISQSGLNAEEFVRYAPMRGVYFSKVVSIGNAVDLGESDFFEYFAEDPDTAIIASYLEGIRDSGRFRRALFKASTAKPAIILKGGATGAGTRAANSHTGSLAGSYAVWSGLARQANVVNVQTLEQLDDVAVAFRFLGPLSGAGVAIIGVGGGVSVLAADAAERAGLPVPPIPEDLQSELREFIPIAGSSVRNPLDTHALHDHDQFVKLAGILSRAPEIHNLVAIARIDWAFGQPNTDMATFLAQLVKTCVEGQQAARRPLAVALTAPAKPEVMDAMLRFQAMAADAGLAVYPTVQRALETIALVWPWYRERSERGMPQWEMPVPLAQAVSS
jgi:acyl-CoA synthetase (NDP forming)